MKIIKNQLRYHFQRNGGNPAWEFPGSIDFLRKVASPRGKQGLKLSWPVGVLHLLGAWWAHVESHGPGPFSRVPHLCNLISFSHRPTVLLQCGTLSSQLCAELHLFWLLLIRPNLWAFFVWTCLSFLFGIYLGVKFPGPMVGPFEQLPNCPEWPQHFKFSLAMHENSNFSTSLVNTCYYLYSWS